MHDNHTSLLLRLLAFLVEARLCGNVVSLDGVLLDSLPVSFTTRHTHLSPSLNLLQLKHPIRNIAPADLHHVCDRTQHRLPLNTRDNAHLVIFGEQRNRHSLSTGASCSSHAMDVLNSALFLTPSACLYLWEVVVHHRVQPQEIQSTSQQVRCDEHPGLSNPELVDRCSTRRLGQIRVDHIDAHIYASAHRLLDPLSYASSVYSWRARSLLCTKTNIGGWNPYTSKTSRFCTSLKTFLNASSFPSSVPQ